MNAHKSWRPKYVPKYAGGYDLILYAKRARLEAKWQLFQARRRGENSADLAQRERNVEYYDVAIPRWEAARAETEAQRARMLRAAEGCVQATEAMQRRFA